MHFLIVYGIYIKISWDIFFLRVGNLFYDHIWVWHVPKYGQKVKVLRES